MPLYEYRCQRCDDVFEVMQRFSDEPLTTHENCGGVVERLISAPALQFKGSGWYITDYARAGSNGNGAAKDAGGNEGKSSPPSKEAKSDAKSETKPAPAASGSSEKK
jgi:putative FmdB family regulatory protein